MPYATGQLPMPDHDSPADEEILDSERFDSEFPEHDSTENPDNIAYARDTPASAGENLATPAPVVIKTWREAPATCPVNTTRWKITSLDDGMRFGFRGRWTLQGLGMLILCNLIWNGGISLVAWEALLKPGVQKFDFDWFSTAAFMSIFLLFGLLFLVLLILELIEPFHTRVWTYDSVLVTCRIAWFGIGWSWAYPRQPLERIEVHHHPKPDSAGKTKARRGVEIDHESRQSSRLLKSAAPKKITFRKTGAELKPYEKASRIFTLVLFGRGDERVCQWDGVTLEDCEVLAPTLLYIDRQLA